MYCPVFIVRNRRLSPTDTHIDDSFSSVQAVGHMCCGSRIYYLKQFIPLCVIWPYKLHIPLNCLAIMQATSLSLSSFSMLILLYLALTISCKISRVSFDLVKSSSQILMTFSYELGRLLRIYNIRSFPLICDPRTICFLLRIFSLVIHISGSSCLSSIFI